MTLKLSGAELRTLLVTTANGLMQGIMQNLLNRDTIIAQVGRMAELAAHLPVEPVEKPEEEKEAEEIPAFRTVN